MRKGKGELTYHQLKQVNDDLKRQIRNLTAERDKLKADYRSLSIAHNKLLKEVQPKDKREKDKAAADAARKEFIAKCQAAVPPAPMGFLDHHGLK